MSRPTVVVLDYGFGQRALRRAGARAGRRRRRRHLATATAALDGRRAASCPASAPSPPAWRASRRSGAPRSSGAGSPAAARCSASASACRSCSSRGVEHGVETEGCGEWPGVGRAAAGTRPAAHGLEHGRRSPAGLPAVRRASRASGSTSCTPTPRAAGRCSRPTAGSAAPLVTWTEHGEPFVAAVENGAAVGHPVPPREVRRRRRPPARQLGRDRPR